MRTALLVSLITSLILTISCGPPANVDSRAPDIAALQRLDGQWSATAARSESRGPSRSMPMTPRCFLPTLPIVTDRKVDPLVLDCHARSKLSRCPGRFPKAKWRNPANSGRRDLRTVHQGSEGRSAGPRQGQVCRNLENRQMESGDALWILTTPRSPSPSSGS
jgi:hypothetical protein